MKWTGIYQLARTFAFFATFFPELNFTVAIPDDQPAGGVANQPTATQPAPTGANATGYDYYGDKPWFSVPSVRQQLGFNDEQYENFNRNYQKSWRAYNRDYREIDNKLTPAERQQRITELRNQFQSNLLTDSSNIFPNQAAADRYHQLHTQFLGYDTFNDPKFQQKLNLTDEQKRELNTLNDRWNQQLFNWQRDYPAHRDRVSKQFATSRAAQQQQINRILKPEQRQIYQESVGQPFDFAPDVYFPTSTLQSGATP